MQLDLATVRPEPAAAARAARRCSRSGSSSPRSPTCCARIEPVRGNNKGLWAVGHRPRQRGRPDPVLPRSAGSTGRRRPSRPAPDAVPGWGSPHDPPVAATAADALRPAGVPSRMRPRRRRRPADTTFTRRTPGAPPAITISGLTRHYPGGIVALDGLTMDVPAGPCSACSARTAPARRRRCASSPDSPARRLDVRASPGSMSPADPLGVRRHLGYLEQDPRAYGWMTGREQLRLLGRLHGLEGGPLEAAIEDALDRIDLRAAADRRAGHLLRRHAPAARDRRRACPSAPRRLSWTSP